MPCAYRDGLGWIAEYRTVNHPRGTRPKRCRVPAVRFAGCTDDRQAKAIATAFAEACDSACRQLELPHLPDDVRQALRLNVLSQDQATALLGGQALPPSIADKAPWTLTQANDAHPSTQRMPAAQRWKYYAYLADFERHANITQARDLRLAHVTAYIAHRIAAGDAYDTRRHRLLFIRRAARMVTTLGLPDPLDGFLLDQRTTRVTFDAYDLDEIASTAHGMITASNWKALCALALGGCVGLRPSECFDAEIKDLTDDVLATGKKTPASARKIPLPPLVHTWLKKLIGTRTSGAIFLNTRDGAYTERSWSDWLCTELEKHGPRRIKAKELRKSFTTWTIRGDLNERHIEAFLGHEDVLTNPTTRRHYLADWLTTQIRPTAIRINTLLTQALAKAGSPTAPPTKQRKGSKAK